MPSIMHKVTAFVIRDTPAAPELLILEHPFAGLQLPAGTWEPGETPAEAALREAQEETGLAQLEIVRELAVVDTDMGPNRAIMGRTQKVYSRPDVTSLCWAHIRSGLGVNVLRRVEGWAHVRFTEWDVWPQPNYASYEITGWLPDDALCDVQRRHFYLLRPTTETPDRWTTFSDNHIFTLFWAPLDNLPALVDMQQEWLQHLHRTI